jgi:hypothetical protein
MDTRKFPATTEQLLKLADKLKAEGIVLDPTKPSGEASADGFDISWEIDADSITVNVLKHPFGEEGIFFSRLADALKS